MPPLIILEHRKHNRRRAWTLLFPACWCCLALPAPAHAAAREDACPMDAFVPFQVRKAPG